MLNSEKEKAILQAMYDHNTNNAFFITNHTKIPIKAVEDYLNTLDEMSPNEIIQAVKEYQVFLRD